MKPILVLVLHLYPHCNKLLLLLLLLRRRSPPPVHPTRGMRPLLPLPHTLTATFDALTLPWRNGPAKPISVEWKRLGPWPLATQLFEWGNIRR